MMANVLKEFGEFIKKTRIEKGFSSQRHLSDTIGVSNATIARIEKGLHEASDETLRKLADAFNMDYMDLLNRQLAGTKEDMEMLLGKIQRLEKSQINIISSMVDEFLRLGGKGDWGRKIGN